MKRLKTVLCAVLCMAVMTACSAGGGAEEARVTIDKKGRITGVIVEEFTEEYYSKEDLKTFTLEEIAVHNAAHGDNAVSLSELEVKDGLVTAKMEYASGDEYAAFNSRRFFTGTVEEAYQAGYSLDITLRSAAEPEKTIGKSEILEMGGKHIVIAEENILYQLPSKALYISQNAETSGGSAVRKSGAAPEGVIYIIY